MRVILLRWLVPVCLWSVGAGAARVDAQDQEVEVMRAAALHLRSTIPEGRRVTVDAVPSISNPEFLRMLLGGEPAPLSGPALAAVVEILGADVRRDERGTGFAPVTLPFGTDLLLSFVGPVIEGDEARVSVSQRFRTSQVGNSTAFFGGVMHLTRSAEGWRFVNYGFVVVS